MKLQVVCMLLVAGFGAANAGPAQTRPVFTGTWKFVADKSTPANPPALGAEFRIAHEANALVLELPVTGLVKGVDGQSKTVDAGLGAPMAYKTDGAEYVMEPRNPLLHSEDPEDRTVKFNYIPGGPYRVTWKNNSLVIASSDYLPLTSFRNGFRVEFAHCLRSTTFSMNPDGTLVVERTTERDPADKGQVVISKTVLKSFYRKAS